MNGEYDDRLEEEVENIFTGPGLDVPIEKPSDWRECFDLDTVEEPYRKMVEVLFDNYRDAYALHALDLGKVKGCKDIEIDLEVTQLPPKAKIYPIAPPLVEPTRKIINELCATGVLKPGIGICQSSAFLVPKNVASRLAIEEAKREKRYDPMEHKYRLIIDFRPLNSVLVETYCGGASISHIYEMLHKKRFCATADLASAFFQIPVTETSQKYLSISLDAGLGTYTFTRIPMGLSISPSVLLSAVTYALNPREKLPNGEGYRIAPLHPGKIIGYMDDLLLVSDTPEEMNQMLHDLFARLIEVGFKVAIKKIDLFRDLSKSKIEILGENCDNMGRTITNKKCEISEKYPRPTTIHGLMKLLGFYTYISPHIPHFQTLVAPFTDKLSVRKGPLEWDPTLEQAFNKLKEAVVANVKLYHLDYDEPLFLQTDSSEYACGGALLQYIHDEVRVIDFHSIKYTKAIRQKYSVVSKEALGVVLMLSKYRRQLEAVRQRAIITDASAVVYILSGARAGNSRLARLSLSLQSMPFRLIVKHRQGKDNYLPDALSRFFSETKPHLKLKNANAVKHDELILPALDEGQVVSIEQLHSFVSKSKECVLPFLRNKQDIHKVEEENLVQEIHTLERDLDWTMGVDNSLEGQQITNLLQPLLDRSSNKMEVISLAAREVTWENIIKAQRKDPSCLKHIRDVETGHELTNKFRIENGMLVKKRYPNMAWSHPGNSLICIPGNDGQMISHIIASLHFGHHGLKKMLRVIRTIYYIPKVKKHVTNFVTGCAICSLMRLKHIKRDPNAHHPVPQHPMQFLDLDFFYMEKFGKFAYVLNICDRYSKKTFAVPTATMHAKVVIKALEGIFSNHGIPQQVSGDNQPSLLRNEEVINFCRKYQVRIRTGIPYWSQSQAGIESQNASLKFMLKSLCLEKNTQDWPSLMNLCIYLMNTSPHSALPPPLCPDMVHFGREVVLFPFLKNKFSGHVVPEEYLSETNKIHRENRKAIAAYNKMRFKTTPWENDNKKHFAPGKLVYFRRLNPNFKAGTGPKYVNTIYKIERCYHNMVELVDILKVTSPPYKITTTVYFIKPFTPRDPFLFKHIQADQKNIGGPLMPQDLPTGNEDNPIVPDVFNPDQSKMNKNIHKKIKYPDPDETESEGLDSEGEEEASEEASDIDNPKNVSLNPAPSLSPDPKKVVPNHSPTKSLPPKVEKNPGKLVTWLKEAIMLPGRQTRSGKRR